MDKRKLANQRVKDQLLSALIELMQQKDWSKLTITELIEAAGVARASFYRNFKSIETLVDYALLQMSLRYEEGSPTPIEDFHNWELMRYKFQFYGENSALILAFHHAKSTLSLLDIITDCVIEAHGDMPITSITRYELYYYAGAFYNMVLCWLENGKRESPEAMADEFLRIIDN